jgi:voltage-gated potassium channel
MIPSSIATSTCIRKYLYLKYMKMNTIILKRRVYEIMEATSSDDVPSEVFQWSMITLILLNVVAVTLESVEKFASRYAHYFSAFEVFSIAVFTLEYVLRLYSCTADRKYRNPLAGRIRFLVTPLTLVDLMAILPFYLPMIFPLDLRFIRVLRLFRVFRVFKMGRYSESFKTFVNVLKARKEDLAITVFSVLILLQIASSLMYYAEHSAQPERFSSIPAAMWWGVTTLTTLGYGDIYPVTIPGKILGAVIALLGIGLFALPAGILASGFAEEIQKKHQSRRTCPYCGREIE